MDINTIAKLLAFWCRDEKATTCPKQILSKISKYSPEHNHHSICPFSLTCRSLCSIYDSEKTCNMVETDDWIEKLKQFEEKY